MLDTMVQVCFSSGIEDPREGLLSYYHSLSRELSPLILWDPRAGSLSMGFSPDHYVPVLKVKRGEMKALRLISSSIRERITPLLEIVQRSDSSRRWRRI